MRLLDGDGLARLGLPVGGEGLVELLVELAGRIIGDVEQRLVGQRQACRARQDETAQRHRQSDGGEGH